ncbi:hypothetical protein [Pelagibaculum spongiae]|uniref:Tle cognate immunity protein 4 C-terminal domain-containing protein n=1 Tax=Pelagibaculum spongiae TaxID=2080658 RepID=A0A2V1H0J3_9GAMM|nr:hypothetical protein [Pelagibaculum spongiae]PVZ68819.1 hypothetical protein DC094_11210 [Pelagibaculum spongiae]
MIKKIMLVLLAASLMAGCVSKRTVDMPFSHLFKEVCVGRYQIELPIDLEYYNSLYKDGSLTFDIRDGRNRSGKSGLYSYDNAAQLWIENTELKSSERIGEALTYYEDYKSGLDLITSYDFFDQGGPYEGYILDAYGLRKFSDHKYAIEVSAPTEEYESHDRQYKNKYAEIVKTFSDRALLFKHQAWPHNQLGVCINNDILMNTANALPDEYLSVMHSNGKRTSFRFVFEAYSADRREYLQQTMDHETGIIRYFASERFSVAGRSGRLLISPGRYSEKELQFKWVASSPEAGSTRFPYMEIRGKVRIDEYPELHAAGMTNEAFLVLLLDGMKVRDNGLVGTR